MAIININNELNGIEITFEAKPSSATLEALKANGYRWHKVKKLWYAKQNAERLALAESLTGGQPAPVVAPVSAPVYNLENLGENKPHLYGAELAAAIREDLKKRGVNGVTVRARKITYDTGITVTIKATPADFVSVEEFKKYYNFSAFACDADSYSGVYTGSKWLYYNEFETMTDEEKENAYNSAVNYRLSRFDEFPIYHHERTECHELTRDFYNKCLAVFKIANQWNYDNSDSMTDYFDIGYYLDIDIKKAEDFAPRQEMTEADRDAYEKETAERIAKEEADRKAWEEEQAKRKAEAEKYEAWRKEAETAIYNNVIVEDIPEEKRPYITGLAGGIGKEASLDELRETIAERIAEPQEAVISRKVVFSSESVFDDFCKLFLHDFTFLEGKGGTASDDIRLKDFEMYNILTPEQRESIKFYNSDCIAVYVGDALRLVINPQGYSYARYVYIPTESTEIRNATEESAKQTAESEEKPAFYIPAPVEEQAKAIKCGQAVTIYQCDGWILNNIYAGAGIVEEVTAGKYAQYSGLWLTLSEGKKKRQVFIHNGNNCLIYNGIWGALPEEVTSRRISENMREMFNYNKLLPNTYNYYKSLGITPILDTCPR